MQSAESDIFSDSKRSDTQVFLFLSIFSLLTFHFSLFTSLLFSHFSLFASLLTILSFHVSNFFFNLSLDSAVFHLVRVSWSVDHLVRNLVMDHLCTLNS